MFIIDEHELLWNLWEWSCRNLSSALRIRLFLQTEIIQKLKCIKAKVLMIFYNPKKVFSSCKHENQFVLYREWRQKNLASMDGYHFYTRLISLIGSPFIKVKTALLRGTLITELNSVTVFGCEEVSKMSQNISQFSPATLVPWILKMFKTIVRQISSRKSHRVITNPEFLKAAAKSLHIFSYLFVLLC